MHSEGTHGRAGMMLRRLFISAVAAGAALLAGACAVGPDYVRPEAPVPANFKELDSWKVAQPREDLARGAWWKVYQDPALDQLQEQAQTANQNIIQAEAQFRQARALVQAARASYFPTVSAGASYTRARRSENTTSGSQLAGGTTSDYLLPVDVSWDLDVWGRIRRSVEASEAGAQASKADLESARLSMQAELALDYFQLRTLDAQRQLLEATVESYRNILALNQKRYASGVASMAEVAQAETQLKSTQAQALDIGVQRAQMEHAIALLCGKAPADLSLPAAPLTASPPAMPVGLPSALLERRPDIAAAERRVAAANAQIGVAQAAFFPSVTLGATGGFESSSWSNWLSWPSRFWSVGPSIAQAVFDGGLRRAQSEQARAAYEASVAAYRQSVLAAFQAVEDNLAALRILEQEAGVQEGAVKSSRQSLAITVNQYKAGTVAYLNVLVAQATTLGVEKGAIDILGRRMSASVLLVKALGGGWSSAELEEAR